MKLNIPLNAYFYGKFSNRSIPVVNFFCKVSLSQSCKKIGIEQSKFK